MIKFKAIDYCYKPTNLLSKSITDLDRVVTGKRSLNAEKNQTLLLEYAIRPGQIPWYLKAVIKSLKVEEVSAKAPPESFPYSLIEFTLKRFLLIKR